MDSYANSCDAPAGGSLSCPIMQVRSCLVTFLPSRVCVCVAVCVQDRWGPRFFIPARFLPVKYNYFRPVPRRPSSGAGMHSGSGEEGDVEAGGADECVICYTSVDISGRIHMVSE